MKGSIRDIFKRKAEAEDKREDLYKVKKIPYKKDDMRWLEKLMKASLAGAKSKSSARFGSVGSGGGWLGEKDQRVVFKMSYSPKEAVHQKYLNTYMPQENKSQVLDKPVLFGTPDEEYNEKMTGLHFKCIISPESDEVNLEFLCGEFIKRMEALTGYSLLWKGCIHNDTAHRHAHICINGQDKNGRAVRFPKYMIKETMREVLSYVATALVGERTEREIEAAKRGAIEAARWTKLDEELEKRGEKIPLHNLPPELFNRLAFLNELGLSERRETYWTLKPDWKEVLAATGRYNTFLGKWQAAGGNLEMYSGGKVEGVVDDVVTFDKDEAWNDAVIVNDGKRRVYVPVWQLQKDNLVGRRVFIDGGNRALSRQITDKDIKLLDKAKRTRKNRGQDVN